MVQVASWLASTVTPVPAAVWDQLSVAVTYAGVVLDSVLSGHVEVSLERGWPTCEILLATKPDSGGQGDPLVVVAGLVGKNVVTRFSGVVNTLPTAAFPRGYSLSAVGTLEKASRWKLPGADENGAFRAVLKFEEILDGAAATPANYVRGVLSRVPGVTYTFGTVEDSGVLIGTWVPEVFDWPAGTTAWEQVQKIDEAEGYTTYQAEDGTIHRVSIIGHPSGTEDFTLGPDDLLPEGLNGERESRDTKNTVVVKGYDPGNGGPPVVWRVHGSNPLQPGDEEYEASLENDMIESESADDPHGGLRADLRALGLYRDVNKEFVRASAPTYRDDVRLPGSTCLLDTLSDLAIGENTWNRGYTIQFGDDWTIVYDLTGGGLDDTGEDAPPG